MKALQSRYAQWASSIGAAVVLTLVPFLAHAQTGGESYVVFICQATEFVRNLVLIIALAVFVIAGIYLIVGGAGEGKEKAKNMILYALVGVVIIIIAEVIIDFAIDLAFQSPEAQGVTVSC